VTQVVILAGGLGTRLREETAVRPKPMVEVGGRPLLWHIMKIFDHFGHRDFVIPVGYKGYLIKEFFLGFRNRYADFSIDLKDGSVSYLSSVAENWSVTVVDTGATTQTGGRLRRLEQLLDEQFFVTYGDGVADVDLNSLLRFHRDHGRQATVTAVRPSARFGALDVDDDRVTSFVEKSQAHGGWINGGFFVLDRSVLQLIDGDESALEGEPMERLAGAGQLMAYRHHGFWEPMDTQRDLDHLNEQWASGSAPWKTWDD
jgi:glucose-1-phosphate cytidylyltransferase